MEMKSNQAHSERVILCILLLALAAWGSVATVRTVRRDGLRRIPNAPIARRVGERR